MASTGVDTFAWIRGAFGQTHEMTKPCRVVFLLLFGITFFCASFCLAADTNSDLAVQVTERGDVIHVDVELLIPASPKEVWDVLTDFENLPRFISNITSSKIVARDGNTVRVFQSGKTSFGPLTFEFQSEREITLTPYTRFESRMISGNLKRYSGATQLESVNGETKLRFHSESVPRIILSTGLARPLIEAETREHYQEIRNEVVRRRVERAGRS